MVRFVWPFLVLFSSLFAQNGCLACHEGIADIRERNSGMMEAILQKAEEAGAPGNDCVVCHGGNPNETEDKAKAHSGTLRYFLEHEGPKAFYPWPASPWVNEHTCGMCHNTQVSAQHNNLMATEQGKIQGALWGFGMGDYHHTYTNYGTQDLHKRIGTETYRKYMEALSAKEPQAFLQETKPLPPAPTADEVEKNPKLAVYTYLRAECLRCHTGGKGRKKRGDFRGIGCAACHIPYSNEGFYEGGDKSIPKNEAGHLLTHQIQATREAKVHLHGKHYSGVPVETCTTCHNRGKRIGVSYQGLMETAYHATFDEKGGAQPKLHTKRYLHLTEDIHYAKGMLCQDCHTSNDLHGDGTARGANLGAVEIECQDCHGTTKAYPWELPLGYGDEFDTKPKTGKPRGVAQTLAEYLKQGFVPPKKYEGYLLSARGNPMPRALKKGNEVVMHLASGKTLTLKPLKLLKEEDKLSQEALTAMDTIEAHNDRLECYTCHATWAPQCYGCHIKIDYSGGKKSFDYLEASRFHHNGVTLDSNTSLKRFLIDGEIHETRSYLRWEDPPLSQNGEGRISPTIPGCQTTLTVIGKEGKALLQNYVFRLPNKEQGEGVRTPKEGVTATDMSPVHPHTVTKRSRTCENCHSDPKALGYGIGGGRYFSDQSKATVVELFDANRSVIPSRYQTQIDPIVNLAFDYSVMLDRNGTQLQTVGHHWRLSQALSDESRAKLDRSGVCLSCHQSIPDGSLAVSVLTHIKEVGGMRIDNKTHKQIVHKSVLLSAWVQVLGLVLFVALSFFAWRQIGRKKAKESENG